MEHRNKFIILEIFDCLIRAKEKIYKIKFENKNYYIFYDCFISTPDEKNPLLQLASKTVTTTVRQEDNY